MDNFYLILVIVLFALAISDLVVGVANDAVNFLNSAIGSKVARQWVILGVASAGVIIGAMFSDGMMEVARKGVFYPGEFSFHQIMILFLAVMITDIILLDFFNTLGLPTSTTVSIIFELLGAAVAVALVKISSEGGNLATFVNSSSTLEIVSGILLSIVIAFSFGTIVQFLTRLIFSFNFQKTFKYFGSAWSSISITAILYFLVIKGAKGSALIPKDVATYIIDNTVQMLLYSFVVCTIIIQLLIVFFNTNVLRFVVLFGTFALAMAFAGNDLVNFIGVPLAGFESFKAFMASSADPNTFMMVMLSGKIKTETYLLLIAGVVMAITLWTSKKARTVTKTEINLGRQEEGFERFGSSAFSRSVVRGAINAGANVRRILPKRWVKIIERRLDPTKSDLYNKTGKDVPSFDMLRASVNLSVSSILIAFATSMKLPLSTTYVTFMVAMGTSLSDGAWGRESAVYRITGVFTVIGGWFATAFVAFTGAFISALIITQFGQIGILLLLIIAIAFVIRTHFIHKRNESIVEGQSSDSIFVDAENAKDIVEKCNATVASTFNTINILYSNVISGLVEEDRKALKIATQKIDNFNLETKHLKAQVHKTIIELRSDSVESGHYYVQVLDYLRELAHSLNYFSQPVFEHFNNNHKGFIRKQKDELLELDGSITTYFSEIQNLIQGRSFDRLNSIIDSQLEILTHIELLRKKQIKRIKNEESGTKNSVLFLNILQETKNIVLYSLNLAKSHRDFIEYKD